MFANFPCKAETDSRKRVWSCAEILLAAFYGLMFKLGIRSLSYIYKGHYHRCLRLEEFVL